MKNSIEEDIELLQDETSSLELFFKCKGSEKYKIALEHILSDYKRVLKENEELLEVKVSTSAHNRILELEKENETLKKLHIQDNNKLDFVMKHCILEQKIKDKIEELNKKEQKLQNSISAEEREEYSDANISWNLMDINIKREVLQDLIEGRK